MTCRMLKSELSRFEKSLNNLFSKQDGVGRKLYLHQEKVRGKRLRPILLFLSARASGRVKPVHFDMALIVELIHNATLAHDDVLDDSKLRRYLPTINQKWGNEMAILYGDLIFSNAFKTCARIKSNEVVTIISGTVSRMCYGELAHTERRFDFSLTEKEYLEIIEQKTATLFATACYLGAIFTSNDKRYHSALKNYGLNFGMAYQIMDDYLDCTSTENAIGKTAGTDLAKGKMTLPLILLLKSLPANERKKVKRIMSSSSQPGLMKYNANLGFTSVGKEVLKTARRYSEKAVNSLKVLPDSTEVRLLGTLAESIIPKNN